MFSHLLVTRPRRWALRCLFISATIAIGPGCPGGSDVIAIDPSDVQGVDLSTIQGMIQPYELHGSTERGLGMLDAWILIHDGEDRADGLRLRADAHIDLWMYAQLARGVELAQAAAATALLSRRVTLPEPRNDGASFDWLAVTDAMAHSVGVDLLLAGASQAEVDNATQVIRYDPTGPSASADLHRWPSTDHDNRLSLALAGLMAQRADEWLSSDATFEQRLSFVDEFAWLCSDEQYDTPEELARLCGYWCVNLPDPSTVTPTLNVERDVHEFAEDDTPVDFDDVDGENDLPSDEDDDAEEPYWYPTPGDVGYDLVQACGSDYFSLPAVGGMVLLNERNYLHLLFLNFIGELFGQIESELLAGDPLTVMASDLIGSYTAAILGRPLPQEMTEAFYRHDARLLLPQFRDQIPESQVTNYSEPPALRLVQVRSDGVYTAIAPHIALQQHDAAYLVEYVGTPFELHLPGLLVRRFERMNRMDTGGDARGVLPELENALGELEASLGSIGLDRVTDADCRAGAEQPLSLFIDGGTFFETLRPVFWTVVECGYQPVHLHAYHRDLQRTVALPVTIQPGFPETPYHLLQVRPSSTRFQASGSDAVFEVGRVRAPRLLLYQHLSAGLSDGSIDPELPLAITVEGDLVDYGMLAQLIRAVSHARDLDSEANRDPGLFQANTQVRDEQLVRLFPAGLVLVWEGEIAGPVDTDPTEDAEAP